MVLLRTATDKGDAQRCWSEVRHPAVLVRAFTCGRRPARFHPLLCRVPIGAVAPLPQVQKVMEKMMARFFEGVFCGGGNCLEQLAGKVLT